MNLTSDLHSPDSLARPLERLSFDLIRAMVGARQAATPTACALRAGDAGAPASHMDDGDGRAAAMALLAGRREAKVNDGSFAQLDSADRSCPNGDEHHG